MIYAESWNGDVKIVFPCGCTIRINIWHGEDEAFNIAGGETEAEAEFRPCKKHEDRKDLKEFVNSSAYEIADSIADYLGLRNLYELCVEDEVKVNFPIEKLEAFVEYEYDVEV